MRPPLLLLLLLLSANTGPGLPWDVLDRRTTHRGSGYLDGEVGGARRGGGLEWWPCRSALKQLLAPQLTYQPEKVSHDPNSTRATRLLT